jgi:aldoxime dehydratase
MAKIRPEGFEPPYPAWSPALPDNLSYVQAQVAIQSPEGERNDHLFDALVTRLRGDGDLRHAERVGHVDARGAYNDIAIAYWKTPEALGAWLSDDGPFAAVVDLASESGCGVWYEAIVAPRSHYEINASTPDFAWGHSIGYDTYLEPYHAYWGAMRDRIEAAEDGGLPGTMASIQRRTGDRRGPVRIELPQHVCLIRTVQGLSDTGDEEASAYRKDMKPQYEAGVSFLGGHPMESRCLSARLVRYDDPGPGRPHTETLAWFTSLADLEHWVHDHPTHKAIFEATHEHAARFAPEMRLLLGHEVIVAPAGGARAMYVGCHTDTGLMPWFAAAD